MVGALVVLAAQVLGSPQGAVPPPGSGTELMVQCVALDGMLLGAKDVELVEKGALCIGYVEGYMDGAKAGLCIPPGSIMAVIHSYMQYMVKNQKYNEMPKVVGLRAAIGAAYQCRE